MAAKRGLSQERADPADRLRGRCRELKRAASSLARWASSDMPAEKMTARLRTVCELRADIERDAREWVRGSAGSQGRAARSMADARKYLREAQRLFDSAARDIKSALDETGDEFASLRRARRVVKSYGAALERGSK